MWITFPEEEDQQINSTVTEEKKLTCTYKNYIYQDKNWECSVCNANDDYYEYYHYILYKRIHPKNWAYKMRPNQQYKYLKFSSSNSREGEDTY